uniref:Uncharacterized protein n=1 Tax=Bionectria ochroleuca TaxID=29856 RepID=A0A8H7N0D6_BIOOC
MASKSFFAVVAGVGAGTGRSVAVRFAKAYPVVLLSRKPESYQEVVAEIKNSGGQAIGLTADVNDPASLKKAFETVKEQLPGSRLAAAIFNVNGDFRGSPFWSSQPMSWIALSMALSSHSSILHSKLYRSSWTRWLTRPTLPH